MATFEFNLEFELPQLQEELESETYRPGPYRHFTLYERKPHRISAVPFRRERNFQDGSIYTSQILVYSDSEVKYPVANL